MPEETMGFNQPDENLQSPEPQQGGDPIQTVATGLGVASGGLTGAVIGRLVGGRVGAAIGAVVGGVAGGAVGREVAEGVDQQIEGVVDSVKQTVEDIKPSVIGTVDAVKHNIEAAEPSVTGVIDSVRETIDDARPAVTEAIDAVTETIDETRPALVETADAVKTTVEESRPAVNEAVHKTSESIQSSASSIADSVQGAAQSVKGAAESAQPKMTETMESVSEDVRSSVSSVADSVKGTAASAQTSEPGSTMDREMMGSEPRTADAPLDIGTGTLEESQPAIADDIMSDDDMTSEVELIIVTEETNSSTFVDPMSPLGASAIEEISDQADTDIDAAQNEFDRGLLLSSQGDLVGAQSAFEQVIRLVPNLPEAHFNLGILLFQQGQEAEGVAHIQHARDLALFQNNVEAARNLERLLQELAS